MSEYIIGIFAVPQYDSHEIHDLPFCSKDGYELNNIFINNLGIDEGNIKAIGINQSDKIIRTDILRKIQTLSKKCKPDDIIVLYFSGHGYSENNEAYLISYDTDLDLVSDTSIAIQRIKDDLEKCEAKTKILIIDSCYSGIGHGKNVDLKMSEAFENSLFSNISEGSVIFASCKQNEQSFSLEDNSMSVFTHYLIEGLKGNAGLNDNSEISFDDLYTFVTKKVARWAFDNDVSQTPNMKLEYAGKLMIKVKNPEISEITSDEADISDEIKNLIRIELTSSYISPDSEIVYDDSNPSMPPIPTGEWMSISREERIEMTNSNKEKILGNLFKNIVDFYKPSDIKLKEDNIYELPFGKFIILSTNVYSNEFKLIISDELDTENVNNILQSIDNQNIFSWETIEYVFNGNFNFDKVHVIAKQKNYSVDLLQIEKDFSKITFSEKQAEKSLIKKSTTGISISNDSNMAKLKIFQQNRLIHEFFQTIPIDDIIDTFSVALDIVDK